MRQRYFRALQASAAKTSSRTPGLSFEGYWLNERQFYFLEERVDPAFGRVLAVPSIADCETQTVEEVVPLAELAKLLSTQSDKPVDLERLAWADFDMPDANTLAMSVDGHDYLVDVCERRVIQSSASMSTPALYSSDRQYACFVASNDLWVADRRTGKKRALTTDGQEHYCYGQLSETELSAVSYRKRPFPVGLWSPDSQWFITHQVDERDLPEMALVQNVSPDRGRPELHRFKYPLPGGPLPIATFVAVHVRSGKVVHFADCPTVVSAFSPFVLRRVWFDGPDTAWCIRFDRYYRHVELVRLDLLQGSGKVVLSETAVEGYIDLHPLLTGTSNVRTLADSGEVIWISERDGWAHLYLYEVASGELKNRITCGEWMVRDIVHVDAQARKVIFLAAGIRPDVDRARRSLCSVNFDGSGFTELCSHDGDVFVPKTEPCGPDQSHPFRPARVQPGLSPDGRFTVVQFASVEKGNLCKIVDSRSGSDWVIASAGPSDLAVKVRHFDVFAADGHTRLFGVMFLPQDFAENKRYPLIDYIYPGPQVPHQPQAFASARAGHARSLAELGFATIMLDTRGTPIGSRAFHQSGYGELLEPQLADHAAAVCQLCERYSFLNADAVGMIGASGGGAATARALFDYGEIFKVGVAVCGNHDSSTYTAMWSDKYRGPGEGGKWAAQANAAAAHKLTGKLLLINGDMDENVHVSQTLVLADALIRANRDFDLLIVPNAGHGVLAFNGYALRRAWDYFVTHLLGKTPPEDFEVAYDPYEMRRLEKCGAREARQ